MGQITGAQEISLAQLKPYSRNAKKHPEEQVEKIARSIEEFGFLSPVLIDREYNVIAGHGRILAAKKLGLENVPCVFVEGLSEEQRRAYILADNRLGELTDWDMDLVQGELLELSDLNFDITVTGFDLEATDYSTADERKGNMAEKYFVPPFSVIYANKQDWLARKRAWVEKGLHSEIGRGGNLLTIQGAVARQRTYQRGGRTKQSVQEQPKIKQLHDKSKAYADGLIEKMKRIRKGTYNGNVVSEQSRH